LLVLGAGMVRVMDGPYTGPFNIGNPTEFTMLELAQVVKEVVNPDAQIVYKENTADDPSRRKPDISKACPPAPVRLLCHETLMQSPCLNQLTRAVFRIFLLRRGQSDGEHAQLCAHQVLIKRSIRTDPNLQQIGPSHRGTSCAPSLIQCSC
jgi:hypothetical protein